MFKNGYLETVWQNANLDESTWFTGQRLKDMRVLAERRDGALLEGRDGSVWVFDVAGPGAWTLDRWGGPNL